jgi:AAA+ ATPase superfamily predicted ATPase
MPILEENPFVFGTIVSDEYFADRKDELRELVSDLTGKTNIILFSPRRYGKTSLMFQVMKELEKKKIVCAYVDLYPATSKEKFADIFASAIAKAKAGKVDEIIQVIRDLIPPVKLIVRPEGASEMQGGVELELSKVKGDVDSMLTKLYDLPEKIAKKKNKKLVVIFDEFQEITKLDGTEIEKNLRSKIQNHKLVSYVFMGSQRHLIDQIFGDKNKALFRIGKSFNLNKIPKEEFKVFIKDKFKKSRITISDDTTKKILELSESHPYYTQQLCHEVWNLCKSKETNQVTEEIISAATEQVLKNQNYAYTSLWDSIKGKQRTLLLAMADSDDKEIYSSEFRARYSLGASSSVAKAVKTLEEKGLLEKEGNDYVISDAFFKEWLRRLV